MRTFRALGALILLLVGAVWVYAQEPAVFRQPVEVLLGRLFLATNVTLQMEGTSNDANELTVRAPNVDADWTFTFPTHAGANGQQLTTNGSGSTSWAAASSTRDSKDVTGRMDPCAAITAITRAPIYRFHYKAGQGTGDTETEYVGIVADEAPWAMHYDGQILNPVNTAGYAFAALQCQQAQIAALTAELTRLKE